MAGLAAPWALSTQSLAAGVFLCLAVFQGTGRLGSRNELRVCWLSGVSATAAAVLLCNVALGLLPRDGPVALALTARSLAASTMLILILPAIAACTRVLLPNAVVLVAMAMAVLREVLWLVAGTPDLTGYTAVELPYEPWWLPSHAGLLLVVCGYAVVAVLRMAPTRWRTALAAATAAVPVIVVACHLAFDGAFAAIGVLAAVVPLVTVMQLESRHRSRQAARWAERQRLRREDVTRFWAMESSIEDIDEFLDHVAARAGDRLADRELTAAVVVDGDGRHRAEFSSPTLHTLPADDHEYLADLRQILAAAADRRHLVAQLEDAAERDLLTGLPNRRALEQHLEQALDRMVGAQRRLAVVFCDLDNFKQENDQFGHPWGDRILVLIAAELRRSVGEDAFIARFGGDEFVLVIEDACGDAALIELAVKLRGGLAPASVFDSMLPSMSVGIAVWEPGQPVNLHTLMRDADTAMYRAKQSAQGVVLFDSVLREEMLANVTLRRELENAVHRHEFRVVYQEIVDAGTGQVRAYEALARWQSSGRLRMPWMWLPLAESTGLIVQIGTEVLRQVAADAPRLGVPVAVNIAARQLAEPGFVDQVCSAWGRQPWDRLILEVTESAVIDDLDGAAVALSELRSLGARVALDDFGTGYSSLAMLADLPIDIVKVDRSFVQRVTSDQGSAVVQSIIHLANALGLLVVAEGVELEAENRTLNGLGVHLLQGFLIGRPRPVAELSPPISSA